MNKLFFIAFPATLERGKVIELLEKNKAISFWFYHLPYSIFVRSNLMAKELRDIITNEYGLHTLIIIIQINNTVDMSAIVPNNQVELFNNR
jgi:hypothetical protein